MASLRVQQAPQPGAQKSASSDSLAELARSLVNRILESQPKSSSQSNGAGEEILYEVEVDGARYLLVRVSALNLTKASLSPREQEIVRMVAEGHPNKIIADVLNISAWTVCTHLRRIFAKLGVGSRAAMVARFLEPSRDLPAASKAPMAPLFDIFKIEKDGSLLWCEAAKTLDSAKARVKTLAGSATMQYIVVSRATGQRIIVGPFNPPTVLMPPEPPSKVTRGWYHICRINKEKLGWVESAESLQIAETRIKALKASSPGDYVVLDYDPESCDSLPPWTPLSCVLAS